MNKNAIITLRWIGVLPSALVASILAYVLIYYCQHWYFGDDSLYGEYVVPCQASLGSGVAFTVYGTKMAPSYKKETAITIIVLILLLMGAGMFLAILQHKWFSLVKDIVCVIGVIIGYGYSDVLD